MFTKFILVVNNSDHKEKIGKNSRDKVNDVRINVPVLKKKSDFIVIIIDVKKIVLIIYIKASIRFGKVWIYCAIQNSPH